MSNGIGIMVEILVAFLLVLTIGYCIMLNRRLKLLKADEHLLRATISELVTATDIAERAIAGLKVTVRECDLGLGERLRNAERVAADIDRKLTAGKDVIDRVAQIVAAGKGQEQSSGASNAQAPNAPAPSMPPSDAQAVAAAAQAFAERLRMKVYGLAA